MERVTLEQFVDEAPAELLEDLVELFDMAVSGTDERAELGLLERYAATRDRLRARLSPN
jgi:hypothetical protein